jgi:hypothetical protein
MKDFDTRCRWVVSFTFRQIYPQGRSHSYPLDRSLGGPQSLSGSSGEEKNHASSENRSSDFETVAHSYTDCGVVIWKARMWKNDIECDVATIDTYQVLKPHHLRICSSSHELSLGSPAFQLSGSHSFLPPCRRYVPPKHEVRCQAASFLNTKETIWIFTAIAVA